MSPSRPRVLVVDDSAFARRVLRMVISSDPRLEYVGAARDGLDALDQIAALAPDVVTLDLVMPHLDGVGVLRALPVGSAPRVVLVSSSTAESELVMEAFGLGAVELVHKPTARATDRLYELRDELVSKVLVAAGARRPPPPPRSATAAPFAGPGEVRAELVVVGTSTGGPQALSRLLAAMPRELPVPVAIALHIPEEYTAALARRLDAASPLHVVEAVEGAPLRPGEVTLAKGGTHLLVEREGETLRARLKPNLSGEPYVPSVDRLFASAAASVGGRVLGVVLTGMGSDGVSGARAIIEAGGRVLTESESSCVVFGMPRSVQEAALSSADAPIDRMAELIVRDLRPVGLGCAETGEPGWR